MSAEFIVKIRANNLKSLDGILCDALESGGISSFYILTEDGTSLAHLHKEPHMWVERAEADVMAFASQGLEERIENAIKKAKIVVKVDP
jgi:hypothetical protein